jgi:hypothetical protein
MNGFELIQTEKGGGSPSPMHVCGPPPAAAFKNLESDVHISDKVAKIEVELAVVPQRFLVAHAIVADLFAIGKMKIEKRYIRRAKALIMLFHRALLLPE